ncbi:acetylcholinesterase-like isoform X2 [Amphiura filiformis]
MTRQYIYFGFWLGCLLSLLNFATIQAQPEVVVEQGPLIGKTVVFSEHEYINIVKEIDVYEGVPFAEPPVRFEHPVKKAAWNGIYNATYTRPICYQDIFYTPKDGSEISEDCLYMNIYVPRGITDAAVMVWIHGGGFQEGSGSQPDYNGEPLSAVGEVILVTFNYRLGPFGYLTTGDRILPGNYGSMDQIEALKWIQANIHAFGGDKDKVTIFGQSSGSTSVNFLMFSKLSRGLFNQAIMESGTAAASWGFVETTQGREMAFNIGAQLNCTTTYPTQLRQCLRDVTARELLGAGSAIRFSAGICIDNQIDNNFLDDYPLNLIKRQDFQRTTLMLGTNADEGTFFLWLLYRQYAVKEDPPFLREDDLKFLLQIFVPYAIENPLVKDSVYQQYLDWTIQDQDNVDFFRPFVDINTDEKFAAPTDMVARAHAKAGDQVYLYQMTHTPTVSIYSLPNATNPSWLGSGHSEDVPFVFGHPFMRVKKNMELSGPEKELSVKIMRFWTEFAKTG